MRPSPASFSSSADGCQVNSRHRKAVKSLGEGLAATATAPDGLVEAVDGFLAEYGGLLGREVRRATPV